MTEPRHTHCIPVEGLGELEALSPEHPWRRHLADCPHCRALLAATAAPGARLLPSARERAGWWRCGGKPSRQPGT